MKALKVAPDKITSSDKGRLFLFNYAPSDLLIFKFSQNIEKSWFLHNLFMLYPIHKSLLIYKNQIYLPHSVWALNDHLILIMYTTPRCLVVETPYL